MTHCTPYLLSQCGAKSGGTGTFSPLSFIKFSYSWSLSDNTFTRGYFRLWTHINYFTLQENAEVCIGKQQLCDCFVFELVWRSLLWCISFKNKYLHWMGFWQKKIITLVYLIELFDVFTETSETFRSNAEWLAWIWLVFKFGFL